MSNPVIQLLFAQLNHQIIISSIQCSNWRLSTPAIQPEVNWSVSVFVLNVVDKTVAEIRDVKFVTNMDQIGTKLDKSGIF